MVRTVAHPGRPVTTPAGPGRCLQPLPVTSSSKAASQPIRARFHDISLKVSQKDEVSTEKCQKACHSPYSQNRLENSPLEFLRFPFSTAFSHKELMAFFDPYVHVYCQNDEVSPDVHTCTRTRKGRMIPPQSPQQAAPGDCSSSCSARAIS